MRHREGKANEASLRFISEKYFFADAGDRWEIKLHEEKRYSIGRYYFFHNTTQVIGKKVSNFHCANIFTFSIGANHRNLLSYNNNVTEWSEFQFICICSVHPVFSLNALSVQYKLNLKSTNSLKNIKRNENAMIGYRYFALNAILDGASFAFLFAALCIN